MPTASASRMYMVDFQRKLLINTENLRFKLGLEHMVNIYMKESHVKLCALLLQLWARHFHSFVEYAMSSLCRVIIAEVEFGVLMIFFCCCYCWCCFYCAG